MILLEYRNIKKILQKLTFQIGLKNFLKVKNTVPWIYVINYCNEKEIVERFLTKKCKKTNQNKFRVEKSNEKKRR